MLEIKNLSKIYPNGVCALDDVSLSIPLGLFGLLGPNGAGKSTLMRTIATLQEADSGSIHLGELDVLREKDAVRRTLGYLPQEFGLYPKVSAIDLLHHFAVLKGVTARRERKALVDALLQQTNLWDARTKNVGGYSGGMRQRFGIAVALIGDPKLIIVDEPTAGLDPQERVRFLNLLAEIGQESVVILSTHIVDDVAELCSRMAIIDEGRILLEGEPAKAVRALDGAIWSRAIDKAELKDWLARPELLTRKLILGETVLRCHGFSAPAEGFEPTAPQLEDVYFVTLKARASRQAAAALGAT